MKKHPVFVLALSAVLLLSGCGAPAKAPTAAPAPTTADVRIGKPLSECDADTLRQIVVQTGLAYFYHNPDCQYNMTTTLTSMKRSGAFLDTQGRSPESATPDRMYYSHCRSFCSDVYYDAFGVELPSLVQGWKGGFEDDFYRDMIVMQYSYGEDAVGLPLSQCCRDREKFLTDMVSGLQPGDILYGEKGNQGGGHVMLYLGDCFGDGKAYCLHSWPVGGGIMKDDGVNKWEPNGSITLQTLDELVLRTDTTKASKGLLWTVDGTGTDAYAVPNWSFAADNENGEPNMVQCWVIRPLQQTAFTEKTLLTEKALSRALYPYLCTRKDIGGLYCSDHLVPGETITVTETVKSEHTADYHGLTVTETVPEGTTLVAGSVTENGTVDGNTVRWTLDIPQGTEKTLSYQVTVDAAVGEDVTFPEGVVAGIVTRGETFKVGACRVSDSAVKRVTAEAKAFFAEKCPANFENLAFAEAFYREVFGSDITLPKTAQELADAVFDLEVPSDKMMYLLKKAVRGENAAVDRMRVPRNTFGYDVYLDEYLSNRCHATDLKCEFYDVGDIFVLAEKTPLHKIDERKTEIYIYLGDGNLICHSENGTKPVKWSNTVQNELLHSVFLCLRPAITNKLSVTE